MNIDSFSDRLVCCLVNSNLTGSIIDKLYCNNIFTRYGNARDGKRKVYCLGSCRLSGVICDIRGFGRSVKSFCRYGLFNRTRHCNVVIEDVA